MLHYIKKIFNLAISSFKSENEDYTQIPINRAIFLLAIPMMFEMIMESLFAVVDTYFVSGLGEKALTTVGLTESMLTIMYSVGIGISMAGTAIVARRVGEKNYDQAAQAGAQTILLGVTVSIIIAIVGVIFAPDLLRLMKAKEDVIAYGQNYTRIVLGSNIVIMLLFLINGIFRGIGNASIAFKSLLVANGFNIIFCPLFIVGFNWGITGAALATLCGRSIGVLYQFWQLNKKTNTVRLKLQYYKPNIEQLKAILSIASTATLQFIIASGSWIAMNSIIANYGTNAVAGYTIAIRILIFFIMPAWGISNAAATLVGQNLGANLPDRAEKSVWQTAKVNAIFMGVVTLICAIFGKWIIAQFTVDPNLSVVATRALTIITLGYIVYGIGMVLLNSFNGAGDSVTPTKVNFVGYWLFQIPLAITLSGYFNLKMDGVFFSIIITETAVMLFSAYLFKKGKWKLKTV